MAEPYDERIDRSSVFGKTYQELTKNYQDEQDFKVTLKRTVTAHPDTVEAYLTGVLSLKSNGEVEGTFFGKGGGKLWTGVKKALVLAEADSEKDIKKKIHQKSEPIYMAQRDKGRKELLEKDFREEWNTDPNDGTLIQRECILIDRKKFSKIILNGGVLGPSGEVLQGNQETLVGKLVKELK